MEQLKQDCKKRMDKSVEGLLNELKKIRSGRAHVSMLDNIKVNYYGNMSPLNQVSALSCPDARTFLIAPWEPSILKEIEASIVKSDIVMTPLNDGKVIRLKVPELTEERRKDLVKMTKKIVEEDRVSVRMVRRDANEEVKKAQKNKSLSEDDQKRLEGDIQKLTDDCMKKIDKIAEDKEKEILTI